MGKQTARRHRWRLLLLCLLLVIGYVAWCFIQPFAVLRPASTFPSVTTPARAVSLQWPGYGEGAIGALGYGVLATHGAQTAMPTASIAKVITALMVLQQRPLRAGEQGPLITITQTDVDSYNKYVGEDGSVVRVQLGEQISEYQALQALLLPSANNMAETLARWAFGSLDAYSSYATAYAKGLGLNSVKVTDPSGFLPTTVASAHDLTTLGELAMQNPIIAQIAGQPTASIPVQGTIANYNFLLGKDGNIGLKTGNSDQDTGAYLFAFRLPVGTSHVLVVGALMGGPSLTRVMQDANTLAHSMQPYFQQITYVKAGQVVAQYRPAAQPAVQAVAAQSLTLITWRGYSFTGSATLHTVKGAQSQGATVGSIQVTAAAHGSSTSVPIILNHAVAPPGWSHRLLHPF